MVERAVEQRSKVKKNRGRHAMWYGFGGIILATFLVVLWAFGEALPFHLDIFKSEPQPKHIVNLVDPKSQEVSPLDETPVPDTDIAAHVVAMDAPRVLRIPKLQLVARIRQVGTTLSNEPIAPKSIFDVGWYEGSSKLGEEGATLLNGHLAGPNKPGIFKTIQTLENGDEMTVERGDKKVFTYVVSRTQEYNGGQIDMSAATNSIVPGKPGLNLLTTLNKYSGTDKRLIIFAVLKSKN
jgi:hypothetical protein